MAESDRSHTPIVDVRSDLGSIALGAQEEISLLAKLLLNEVGDDDPKDEIHLVVRGLVKRIYDLNDVLYDALFSTDTPNVAQMLKQIG